MNISTIVSNVVTKVNSHTTQLDRARSAMTKAQFNALAEERKANRGGSGFEEWGKHSISANLANVNEGITVYSRASNYFYMGNNGINGAKLGTSKTDYPSIIVSGILHKINRVNQSLYDGMNNISLSTAPSIYPYDTVLTAEQIASGVIKHADASNSGLVVNGKGLSGTTFSQTVTIVNGKKYIIEYKDSGVRKTLEIRVSSTSYNISLTGTNITEVGMYPADAISRSDLVFLESWHEDISEKNIVYPLGNTQYLGDNIDGLTGIANGSFTGFETYSLFGNWQTPSSLIGKGYAWSSLTEAQKKSFISNPDNNCYLDGDKTIQVRYRVRVVQGAGDSWAAIDPNVAGNMYMSYDSTALLRVSAKGKKSSISTELSFEDIDNNIRFYNIKHVSVTSKENGIFQAISANTGLRDTVIAYEGKCFALPIALIHR